MKTHILYIAAVLLLCSQVNAQIVTIPDSNFVNYLNIYGFSGALTGNQMDTQHPSLLNAVNMNCSNQNISNLEGIQYFPNLIYLTCTDNPLTNLPQLPSGLIGLTCRNGLLTSLPSILPANLEDLNCGGNMITQLPILPLTLEGLYCDNNALTTLPLLPSTLTSLYCSDNQLTSLPALPAGLTGLNCMGNQLTTLPVLPSQLFHIECSRNQLTTLPPLPASLNNIVCSYNPITTIPALPSALKHFFADSTQITTLPVLPNGLMELNCSYTLLSSLPAFPPSLTSIKIHHNPQLTSLPAILTAGSQLYINDNPNLHCLPRLPQLGGLHWLNSGITCLPNYANIAISNPQLSTLPLCDVFNINGCDFYYNIAGQVYNDANNNCINEPGEAVVSSMKVNLFQGATLVQQVFSMQNGKYNFDVPYGTYDYSVDVSGMPLSVNCPVSGVRTSIISAADSMDVDMDFGLQCLPGFDVGAQAMSAPHFVPGDTNSVRVVAGDMSRLFNMSCAAGTSGTVVITFSGPVTYVGPGFGSLIPTVTPNVLTYAIADFGSVNPYSDFDFMMTTDTLAQMGDTVCFTVSVTPTAGDLNAANNLLSYCDVVSNSFDPNDKQVYPSGEITQYQPWLTYTVNFQNTGNAPAQHIVISDTLDANLQEATFTLLDASHEVNTVVTGNVVKFIFPNINLPDSVNNEPDSHGYVQFKLKPVTTLQPGDEIENSAAIFFDYNPPIITNTVNNYVGQPLAINDLSSESISVFPNPANEELNLITPFSSSEFELFDLVGRKIMQEKLSGTENKISISNLQSGSYIIIVKKESMQWVKKINVY